MKAYRHLVKYALDQGRTITIDDGGFIEFGEWAIEKSSEHNKIIEAIEAVDEAWVHIFDGEENLGVAYVILCDMEPEEMVADFIDNEWMNAWFDAFNKRGEHVR